MPGKSELSRGRTKKTWSQRLKNGGRLARGAEAHQTTVDWETKLLGLQTPWVKTQGKSNPTRSRPESITNWRNSQLAKDYRLRWKLWAADAASSRTCGYKLKGKRPFRLGLNLARALGLKLGAVTGPDAGADQAARPANAEAVLASSCARMDRWQRRARASRSPLAPG